MKTLKAYWGGWPESLRLAVSYFLVTRLLFTALGTASIKLIGHYSDHLHQIVFRNVHSFSGLPFLDAWVQWDGRWYLHIAQFGYQAMPDFRGQSDIVFFPLYPYLVRVLAWPFHYGKTATLVISLLVSSLALIAAAHFLYQLVDKKLGRQVARLTILALFLSPVGFIFSAVMTESLFLLLLVLAFRWAEDKRWWLVGAASGLLVLTRSPGALAAAVLVIMYAAQARFNWRRLLKWESLWVLGPLIGAAILLAIDKIVAHDALAFIHAGRAWQRGFLALHGPSGNLLTLQGLYLLMFPVLALYLVSRYIRKIGWQYWLLAVALLVIPVTSGLYGLIRYTSVVFPLYILIAMALAARKNWYEPVIIGLALLEGVHFVWWALGMPIMQ